MKLQEIMVGHVVQASPEESIGEAARCMREKAVGCLVVTVEGHIKGIITDLVLLGCAGQRHDPRQCQVSTHMSRPVVVLKPEEDDRIAAEVMRKKRIKRLPIAKNGKLLGIVTLSDLAAVAVSELARLESAVQYVFSLITVQQAGPAKVRVAPQSDGPQAAHGQTRELLHDKSGSQTMGTNQAATL